MSMAEARTVSNERLAVVVGPSDDDVAAFVTEVRQLAERSNARAAAAFLAGDTGKGAAYLRFAERMTLLAGGRP